MSEAHAHTWAPYFSGFRCSGCGKKRGWTDQDYADMRRRHLDDES